MQADFTQSELEALSVGFTVLNGDSGAYTHQQKTAAAQVLEGLFQRGLAAMNAAEGAPSDTK